MQVFLSDDVQQEDIDDSVMHLRQLISKYAANYHSLEEAFEEDEDIMTIVRTYNDEFVPQVLRCNLRCPTTFEFAGGNPIKHILETIPAGTTIH